ncbi:DsbC family protein [Betaproteobacteria bacterium SCN2]|jgi:thiol:disulfide interchange protein DsbC|nr:DsbC family protein [Betaproteobacteria bacterium SCN2]
MRLLPLSLSLLLFASAAVQAGEKEVRQALQKNFAGMEVTSISKTPYGGLYEVVVDGQVVYSTSDGKYLVLGNVIELASKRNLTAARNAKLMEVKWSALPLANAIKEVKGNGSRKLAIFSDADCPYCRKLEPELEKLTNVTIYTFLYPIEGLHPEAVPTSKKIWCEKDRLKAWKAYMLKGEEPKSKGDCANPVDATIELGAKLRVSGTPTIILENGQRIPGYMPADKLDQLLTAASRK